MKPVAALISVLMLVAPPLRAQDIRGLELCTSKKQMERRTGCLQANVEFLQQALAKLTRDANAKLTAADREIVAAKAEIAALKAALAKLDGDLAQLRATVDNKK